MKTQAWKAGAELLAPHPPPPPPPSLPPHMHGHVPAHVGIAEGIQVVSNQVAELATAVEGLQATINEIRSTALAGGAR